MAKKVIYFLVIFLALASTSYNFLHADEEERQNDYKELRDINIGTFNEYGYRITEQFFKLKQDFEVNGIFEAKTLANIEKLAKDGYKYLPDNLNNKKYLNDLESAIRKGEKTNNELIYIEIARAIEKYLYNSEIYKIKGTIEANPTTGNAPLNATLRAKVTDPTGTIIPKDNYIWWIDEAGKKKIIGKGLSINYTLNSEGKFSIFLDVLSNHRNSSNYIDVLPFRSRADIDVKQKIANINIKVNFSDLGSQDILKLSPEDGDYGIVFDATSSTPTSGSKFLKTTWDFGNGIKRENEGGPKVERVVYTNKGDYTVKLKLKTNELHEVERKFTISINNPIATIVASQEQGFIGDRFTFSAKTSTSEKNVTYNWEIVDIDKNETVLEKAGNLFTYEFPKKGKFNVKLKVISPSGDVDNDNKIIYINSRAPIADFSYTIPKTNNPNRVLFDATKSYDEDYSDDGKLDYSWEIDGQKVTLENPNFNGALGYYTFDSVGDHSVVLEITDPDSIKSLKKDRIKINSILSVSFDAFPLVIKRDSSIKFVADSKEAEFFRWDFGDGSNEGLKENEITHAFNKSGIFTVKLEVSDEAGNTNTFSRNVYVSDSEYPYALIDVSYENGFSIPYDSNGCNGKGAYTIDRINNIKFSGQKSINIDGESAGISYSWKIGQENISSNSVVIKKFDEIGCFPIKLSVKSDKNDKIHVTETYVQVKNLLPLLTSLSVQAVDTNSDPIIVNLKAIGDKDKDGVILSYLWYYYTDADEEPQDYRVTVKPETTFVLPKISGTYYFVLTLRDNNEEKYSSENLGTKFYVTLVGDNVNTPLVDLTVNDSSVSVGDVVEFSTRIKNVLGQDLTEKATYSWDFNGDGFYDKEVTGNGNISYKFENSGTYRVKVKAKYKGISNVKSLTIDVTNTLVPDFDYISIFNKTIFLNKSLGKYEDVTWDLGDGNIKDSKDNFIYTYYDGKSIHKVTLRISEGNKYKELKKSVVRNTKNLIKANQKGLNIFSKPEISASGEIVLTDKKEKVFIYLAENKLGASKYVIDYDVNYDSDLNGGKSDDEDNRDTPSYRGGDPIEIKLNENKNQLVRITIYDTAGKEIAKKDIKIIKEYIIEDKEEKDIVFTGVSKSDEEKIKALKNYISKFPQSYRVTGMKYLERLQSEWFDETEKTKVILEFEGFVDNPSIPNSAEVINLLESILIEGEEDKSQKNIAFNALKNLMLNNISCEFDTKTYKSCKEYLVAVLEEIKNSSDVDKNKELGKIILTVIASDSTMTNKEKEDFKEILKILINGDNVEQEKTGTTTPTEEETGFFSKILGFLKWIAIAVMVIIVFIGIIILGFWLYFKFVFKDRTKSFEDFIIDKTKFKRQEHDLSVGGEVKDSVKEEVNELVKDPFLIDNIEETTTTNEPIKEEKVPDWLKASFEQNVSSENETKKAEETKSEEEIKAPEESQINKENLISQNIEVEPSENLKEERVEEVVEPEITKSKDEDITKIEEPNIPDWLKSSLPEDNLAETTTPEVSKTESTDIVEPTPKEDEDITKVDEPVIPDWLKSSLSSDETPKETTTDLIPKTESTDIVEPTIEDELLSVEEPTTKEEEEEEKEITKVDEPVIPDWLKSSLSLEVKTTDEKAPTKDNLDIEDKSLKDKQKTTPKKTTVKEKKKKDDDLQKNGDELWQDGMDIPDWLSDDKKKDDQ